MNTNVIHIADEQQANFCQRRGRSRARSEYNKMYYKLHSEKLKQRNALNSKKRRNNLMQRLDVFEKKFLLLLNNINSTFGNYENFKRFQEHVKK